MMKKEIKGIKRIISCLAGQREEILETAFYDLDDANDWGNGIINISGKINDIRILIDNKDDIIRIEWCWDFFLADNYDYIDIPRYLIAELADYTIADGEEMRIRCYKAGLHIKDKIYNNRYIIKAFMDPA